jgi:glutamate synthase domain-containing protein 3
MGGGIAVVCGYDAEQFESVLGDRACVGMVGGTIYVRGPVKGLTHLVWQLDLDDADREFLLGNMPVFLEKIGRRNLAELTDFSQWKKIVAMTWEERQRRERIMKEFRTQKWVEGGIFGDVVTDDYERVPLWSTPARTG